MKKPHKPRYRVNVCGGDKTYGIYRLTFIKGRKRVRAYQFTDDWRNVSAAVMLWMGRNQIVKDRMAENCAEAA